MRKQLLKKYSIFLFLLFIISTASFGYTIYVQVSYIVTNPSTEKNKDGQYIGYDKNNKQVPIDLNIGEDPTNSKTYEDRGLKQPTSQETKYKSVPVEIQGSEPPADVAAKVAEATEKIITQITNDTKNSPNQATESYKFSVNQILDCGGHEIKDKEEITNIVNTRLAAALIDPILSTSGNYLFTETDLSFQLMGTTYQMGRYYNSGSVLSNLLGKNWYTTMDTRVIRGITYQYVQLEEDIRTNYQNVQALLADAQNSKQSIIDTYNSNMRICNNYISDYETQIDESNRSQYSNSEELVSLRSKLNQLINAYETRKRNLTSTYTSDIYEINNIISNLQATLAQLEIVYIETEHKYAISKDNETFYNSVSSRGTGFIDKVEAGCDVLLIYDENGICYSYRLTAEPVYDNGNNYYPYGSDTENLVPGDYSRVHLNADGTITWHRKDNQIWIYGTNGLIQRMEDLAHNGIDFNYEDGYVQSISFNGTVLYTFSYETNNGQKRLTGIQNKRDATEKISYVYNANGYLWKTTDSDGDTVTFDYGEEDKLTTITKPDGKYVQIKYDALVNGEMWASSTVNEEGNEQRIAYDILNGITYTYTEDGVETKYTWDKQSQKTLSETYADGSVKTYKYDGNGNITEETWCGESVSYTYDERGNRIEALYTGGTKETWTYNENDQIVSYLDRDGVCVTYAYNSDGTISTIQKGLKFIFTGEYDNGLLVKATDGLGVVTTYKYDDFGNVIERTIGNQITEKYTYDGRNRITSYTDGEKRVTTYVYDEKTVTEIAPNNLITVYTYNNRKDLKQVTETDSVTGIKRVTDYEYDATHNLKTISNPDIVDENGVVIPIAKYTYTRSGDVKTVTYSDGKDCWITTYEYDPLTGYCTGLYTTKNGIGECYSETYAYEKGGLVSLVQTAENRVTEYGYDRWNRMTSVTNALGETTSTNLTPAGRTETVQNAYGGVYDYSWTTDGNLLAAGETGATEKVTYTYYDNGAVKTVTDRLGNETEYFYDSVGNLEKTVSPERIVWYTYDKAGRITGQYITDTGVTSIFNTTSSYGRTSTSTTLNSNIIDSYATYSYSADGRTVTVTSGGTYKTTIKLNAFGETISQTDGEGNTVTYEYDALGRAVRTLDGYGKATVYEYNALGSVSKVTYRDGTNVSYVYDHMGNVTEITDAEGTAAQYTYDSVGRLIKSETRGNPVIEYAYDVLDRVTEVKTAGTVTEKYAYTTRGRLVTAIDAQGKSYSYEYDEFGRLVKENNRLEDSSSYTYDAEGNIETAKDFEGNVTSYSYDAPSRTKTTYYADGTSVIYEYTPSGNIKSVTGATGTITYTYNKAGLLTSQNDIGAGEVTYYSYDRAGNRTKAESDSRTIQYSYGKNGETLSVYDSTNGTKVQLTYDSMGRETKRTYANGNEQVTTYDSLGRKVAIKQTDKRGNTIFAEAYVYKDGRRIATIDKDCNVTYYEYNDFGELSQVLYPYSESLEEEARQEALEAGLVPGFACIEWKSQTADEQILLKAAYLQIADIVSGYGWYGHYQPTTVNVPATERVWKESYSYDLNGNRETKTTSFGTIWYTYDDENRLRFSGRDKLVNVDEEIGGRTTNWDDLTQTEWYASTDETNYTTNSLKGTRFTYDKNGNMLSSENLYSVKFFDYDATNRMALSTVTDLIDHTYTATTYAYDALGRRTLTQTEGHTAERTLYDGMSFEVLRQGTADSNGRFVSTDVAKGRFNYGYGFPFNSYTTYNSSGNWIFDMFFGGMWGFGAGAHGSNQGKEAEPEYYDIENLYPLYANGEAAATYEEDLVYSPHETFWNNWGGFYGGLFGTRESYYSTYSETNYFATDLLGSVKVTTNTKGEVSGKTSYDVFGSLYGSSGTLAEDRLMFAYTGKTWNGITELSNYGFRDYAPQLARFTTVDPIRDGNNWYVYVHNDPANLRDLWGLKPGDIFNSPDEAAADFGLTYNDDSIYNNKEYGASVYKTKGGYTYTVPSIGSTDSVIMSVPPFEKVEAYLHTHAADDPKYDNENFSKTDKKTAQNKGVDIYVATPKGKLKVFNPNTGVTQQLSDAMPTGNTVYKEDETIGFFKNLINHIINFFTGNSNSKKDVNCETKNN